jgi:hypothetical protein
MFVFKDSRNGLYYLDALKTKANAMVLVKRVADKRAGYSKRDYSKALSLVERNLLSSYPVTRDDIVATEHTSLDLMWVH